ncbi:MAG: hypothetical protein ACLSCB_11180, partial [Bifidobacterium pseudocatenulatum]
MCATGHFTATQQSGERQNQFVIEVSLASRWRNKLRYSSISWTCSAASVHVSRRSAVGSIAPFTQWRRTALLEGYGADQTCNSIVTSSDLRMADWHCIGLLA